MSVVVNPNRQGSGSALSSALGMFNTAKNLKSQFDAKPEQSGMPKPEWTTGTDPTKNVLGGQDMSGQLGGQANDFGDQMSAIMRRAYGVDGIGKAAAMDAATTGGSAAGYGAAGEAYGAGGAAAAAGGGEGASALLLA